MSFHTTTPRPTAKQYTFAADPFNSVHADMILRSSDFIEFRVHKSILTVCSPHWESVIQSFGENSDGVPKTATLRDRQGRPIMNVGEDSNTLDLLLRLVYPIDFPPIDSVWDAFTLLEAARKCGMVHAIKASKKAITQYAETNPLRVYVLAAKRGWDIEMRAAAFASLAHPIQETYVQELEDLHAGVYFRLLAYHRLSAKAASARVVDLSWMSEIAVNTGWQPCWATCSNTACRKAYNMPSAWFQQYVSGVMQAIRTKPRSKTLDEPALMDVALVRAVACEDCRDSALVDLRTFNTYLGEKIERVIEDVYYLLCV